ncbi:zinc finger, CCHC-type containing protein [Tanacetum coccineum]
MGRVSFEVELQGAQGNREAEVFQVSNDDVAVAQRWLKDKQPEEKTNTDRLVKEQEKVHIGIKAEANITVTGVPGQEGAEGNVAEKKKVEKSMKANLRKLLKYKAWLTRWSPGLTPYEKKKYAWEMLYIYMLGYDVDFGHMEAVSLISAPTYLKKKVGCIVTSCLLNENHDFLRLAINAVHNDIIGRNEAFKCLALTLGSEDYDTEDYDDYVEAQDDV